MVVYLDDFLIRITHETEMDPLDLTHRVEIVRAVFESLGLIINAKSRLVPAE